MEDSQLCQRSSRRRIRPVEFWNFEKPEESTKELITYNEEELSRCSVFSAFSRTYLVTPKRTSIGPKKPRMEARKNGLSTLSLQNGTKATEGNADDAGQFSELSRKGTENNHATVHLENGVQSAEMGNKGDNATEGLQNPTQFSKSVRKRRSNTEDATQSFMREGHWRTTEEEQHTDGAAHNLLHTTQSTETLKKNKNSNNVTGSQRHSSQPPGKKQRQERRASQGKANGHSTYTAQTTKPPPRANQQEGKETEGRHEQAQASRLQNENQNLEEDSVRGGGGGVGSGKKRRLPEHTSTSHGQRGRRRISKGDSGDISTASQNMTKKRKSKGNSALTSGEQTHTQDMTRKKSNENLITSGTLTADPNRHTQEPQTKDTGSCVILPNEDTITKIPDILAGLDLMAVRKGNESLPSIPPPNSANKCTPSLLSHSRDPHSTPHTSLSLARTSMYSVAGRDTTQNMTAFEQPSFQNVLSSTALDVFKKPLLPPPHPRRALKVSTMFIDPSIEVIPEEEEEEEKEVNREEEKVEENKEREEEIQTRKEEEDEEEEEVNKEEEKGEEKNKKQKEEIKRQKEEEEEEERQTADSDDGDARTSNKATRRSASSAAPPAEPRPKESQGDATQDTRTEASQTFIRHSTRVRMKPLEFWNFEKVEVNRQADGKVEIIHQKQHPVLQNIQKRVVDCSMASTTQPGLGMTLTAEMLGSGSSSSPSSRLQRKKVKETPMSSAGRKRTADESSVTPRKNKVKGSALTSPRQGKQAGNLSEATPRKRNSKNTPRKNTSSVVSKGKHRAEQPSSPSKGRATPARGKATATTPKGKRKSKISPIKATSPRSPRRKVDTPQILSSWTPNRTVSKSVSKSLFIPEDDFQNIPAEEETSFKRKMKGGVMSVQIKKFKDIDFMKVERKTYCCYVARALQVNEQEIYTGFLFLDWGTIVWKTTKKTTIYVIDGCGNLKWCKEQSDKASGHSHNLKARASLELKPGVKVSLKKDGRCRLLKLHIVIGSQI